MLMVMALWVYGGICIDSLDAWLVNPMLLETYRSYSPFLVVGNCVSKVGGMIEPDTVGCVQHEVLMLALLSEMCARITSRVNVGRGYGPAYAVCQAFTKWARMHQLTAWNVVHRSMRGKIRCLPTPAEVVIVIF